MSFVTSTSLECTKCRLKFLGYYSIEKVFLTGQLLCSPTNKLVLPIDNLPKHEAENVISGTIRLRNAILTKLNHIVPSNRSNHGLRTPNEAFLHQIPKLLVLCRQFGQINFGALGGIFGQFISTHFGTVSPLTIFSLINYYFYKKLSLCIQIPHKYLELGFEFGI